MPRLSSTLRGLARAALLLTAAAVMTWFVSWACALWAVISWDSITMLRNVEADPALSSLPRELHASWKGINLKRYRRIAAGHGPGIEAAAFAVAYEGRGPNALPEVEGYYIRTGWPLPCLEFANEDGTIQNALPAPPLFWKPRDRLQEFVPTPGWKRMLPLCPVWRAYAVNTAVMAALALAAIETARWVRRRRRRSKGLCPACAYNRHGLTPLAPCPECGAASI